MNRTKNITKDSIFQPVITDFGQRKVSRQNFSFIICLPRMALKNSGIESQINVKLVQDSEEKYIKLTPIKESGEVKNK